MSAKFFCDGIQSAFDHLSCRCGMYGSISFRTFCAFSYRQCRETGRVPMQTTTICDFMAVPSQGLYGPPFSLHHQCEQAVVGFVIATSETMVNSDRRNEARLIFILPSFHTSTMPLPMLPGAWLTVNGTMSLPPGLRLSSQILTGAVAPAFTKIASTGPES